MVAARRQLAGAGDDSIGGEAFSEGLDSYDGPCRLTCLSTRTGSLDAVFPTRWDAETAARYAVAITIGGFHSAVVAKAIASEVTHASWQDWIAE